MTDCRLQECTQQFMKKMKIIQQLTKNEENTTKETKKKTDEDEMHLDNVVG